MKQKIEQKRLKISTWNTEDRNKQFFVFFLIFIFICEHVANESVFWSFLFRSFNLFPRPFFRSFDRFLFDLFFDHFFQTLFFSCCIKWIKGWACRILPRCFITGRLRSLRYNLRTGHVRKNVRQENQLALLYHWRSASN